MPNNSISGSSNPYAAVNAAATAAGASSSSGSSSSASASASDALNQVNFLNLMMSQLQNQDPTQPMDTSQMSAQLAQIGSVTGINQLNASFTGLANSLTSNQVLQASSLLGHDVLVKSSSANLPAGGRVNGAVNVVQGSGSVSVQVFNAAGALVKTIPLGTPASGMASFSWDGTNASGNAAPAGAYILKAQGAGNNSSLQTLVSAQVQSVTLNGGGAGTGGLTLNVSGVGDVPFSSVTQISQ